MIEAEDKEYKPPVDLIVAAPQTGSDNITSYNGKDCSYPLLNFFKNKRVGDLSPGPTTIVPDISTSQSQQPNEESKMSQGTD